MGVSDNYKCPTPHEHTRILVHDVMLHFPGHSLSKLVNSYGHEVFHGSARPEDLFPLTYREHQSSGFSKYLNIERTIVKACYPYTMLSTSNEFLSRDTFVDREEWEVDGGGIIELAEYLRAKEIWDALERFEASHGRPMNWKSFICYYLLTDVLVLADSVIGMAKRHFKTYQLWICSFVSLPSFVFNFYLSNNTKYPLETIVENNTYCLFENSTIGGVCQIGSLRLAKSRFDGLPDDGNEQTDEQTDGQVRVMSFYDATSLYSSAMSMNMGYKSFRMLDDKEIEILFHKKKNEQFHLSWNEERAVERTDERTGRKILIGYFLQVDVSLENADPSTLQLLEDSALYPERRCIEYDRLSYIQKKMRRVVGIKGDRSQQQIVLTLDPKYGYACDFRYLALSLRLGYKLEAIHTVCEYEMGPCMRDFINFNIKLRQNAKTVEKASFAKNMNNCAYVQERERERESEIERERERETDRHRQVENVNFNSISLILSQIWSDQPFAAEKDESHISDQ